MPHAVRHLHSIVSETILLLNDYYLVSVTLWYQTGRLRTVKYAIFMNQFPAQHLEYIGIAASVTYFACKNQFFERFSIFLEICFTSKPIFPDNCYKMADSFSFQAKVASRGYHVYKETTCRNAMKNEKVTVAIGSNEASKQIDQYCSAIQIKSVESFVTVGHIHRDISRHCNFFLKEDGEEINGNVFSTTYRPSAIPSGNLEVSPVLGFQGPKYVTHCKMKKFV